MPSGYELGVRGTLICALESRARVVLPDDYATTSRPAYVAMIGPNLVAVTHGREGHGFVPDVGWIVYPPDEEPEGLESPVPGQCVLTNLPRQFPMFDLTTLPDLSLLPPGFFDQSFETDPCPRLAKHAMQCEIWLGADKAGARYSIVVGEEETLTDDWDHVITIAHEEHVRWLMKESHYVEEQEGADVVWSRSVGDGTRIAIACALPNGAVRAVGCRADEPLWMLGREEEATGNTIATPEGLFVTLHDALELATFWPSPRDAKGRDVADELLPAYARMVRRDGLAFHPDGLTGDDLDVDEAMRARPNMLDRYEIAMRIWAALGLVSNEEAGIDAAPTSTADRFMAMRPRDYEALGGKLVLGNDDVSEVLFQDGSYVHRIGTRWAAGRAMYVDVLKHRGMRA